MQISELNSYYYLNIFFFFFLEPVNKFIRELKDLTAHEKGAVSFECETAQPASKVTWLKGVKEIKAGRKYQMTQKERILILTVKDLEEADGDTYSCSVDTAKSTAKLTVQGKRPSSLDRTGR